MNEKALLVIAILAATLPSIFSGWVTVANTNAQQPAMTMMDNHAMEGAATNENMSTMSTMTMQTTTLPP